MSESAEQPATKVPDDTLVACDLHVGFDRSSQGSRDRAPQRGDAVATGRREHYANADLAGVLASTSICFDLSVWEFFVPLSWGGTVHVAQNALQLPELATAHAVTLINTVPSAITELVRMGQVPSSVRRVNLAGEPLQNGSGPEDLRTGAHRAGL